MAAFHVRSNSFPSKTPPFVPEIKEQLNRINSSQASSSSEQYNNISRLQDLHECIDKLLTQKAFAKDQHEKFVDELLDGSLRLLDLCSVAKDALMQTKESVYELQSIMRRKIEGQETEIKKYLASRKVVKSAIKKAIQSLKGMQKKHISTPLIEDQEVTDTFALLREVGTSTFSVFESLLSFILGSETQSKPNGWSIVSRLMHSKKVACEGEEAKNEFEKVDAALRKTSKSENLQDKLKDLEMCVQDLEERLECLNRRLIKTRVSLLNILNH